MATALFSALSTHEVWGTGRIPLAAWVQSLKEKLDKPRVNTPILVSDPMQIKCGREDERKSDLLSDQILFKRGSAGGARKNILARLQRDFTSSDHPASLALESCKKACPLDLPNTPTPFRPSIITVLRALMVKNRRRTRKK